MKNYKVPVKKRRQTGLSLIELMVAMLIGLFLLTSIASSYISSKKSSIKTNELTRLEDNGRLALEVLSRAIEHTGYTPINGEMLVKQFIDDDTQVISETCTNGTKSVINKSIFNKKVTQDNKAGDGIAIMFNGDSRVFTDCSGGILEAACQVPPPGTPPIGASQIQHRIYNAFFLKNSELRCVGSRDNDEQTIADGIENIQFLYGLSSTGEEVERYVNATTVKALDKLNPLVEIWNNVVSVQIAVLVRSQKPVKSKKEQITYTLLDQKYQAKNDKYQRAVFNTTIRLRNTL